MARSMTRTPTTARSGWAVWPSPGAPTDRTELTLSYLQSIDETDSLTSSTHLSDPGQLVVDPLCLNVPYILSLRQNTPPR